MPIYAYTVKDQKGRTVTGTIETLDLDSAHELLRERRYIVISLREKKESKLAALFKSLRGVSFEEKVLFARQLVTMTGAGLPLANSLEVLRDQVTSPRMKEVLIGMHGDVQGGSTLSKSMKKYPDVFSEVHVALTEAGEATGKLDVILLDLAEKLERERSFRGAVIGALIYPALLIIVMTIIFIIMIVFVIPRLAALFEDVEAELPLATSILIAISNLVTKRWWLLLLSLASVVFLVRQFLGGEYGRYKWARLSFKTPIIGRLNKAAQLTGLCRTLGLLVGAGVPITQSLELVAGVTTNILYRDAILNAAKQVEKGVPLSTPLRADPNIPPMVSYMIVVGEKTGKLDEALDKVADFFGTEAEQGFKNISALLGPLIVIFMGGLIGLFVLAIIGPIYSLTAQI